MSRAGAPALLLLLLCAVPCARAETIEPDLLEKLRVVRPKVRMAAPDFTLDSLDGEPGELRTFAGKVVLLNFWATWCRPCRNELPALQGLWERFRDRGLVIVAVSADTGRPKRVRSLVEELGLTFPVLLDPDGEVRNAYEVAGLPYSYLIGADGKFVGRVIGERDWEDADALALIEHLLREAEF